MRNEQRAHCTANVLVRTANNYDENSMMKHFDFRGLFIYDLANNHQGDVEHALKIIQAMGQVTKETGVRAAFKFQFRQLETFIHPDYQQRQDVPHIPRFMSTALTKAQYKVLVNAVKEAGMITLCTPFDEESVDTILELGIEAIKVASCSATDFPLLERIAEVNRPIIVSTAGLSMQKVDRLVSFFEAKDAHFALMHCVALYPTPPSKLQLNQIAAFRDRFPHIPIGFSTHETPDNYVPIRLAFAKGAELFERHVGLKTEQYSLNAYSATPAQITQWISAYQDAVEMCGGEHRSPAGKDEIQSLRSLMRGVYAKAALQPGASLTRENVFFAMPLQEGQLTSGEWKEGLTADRAYVANEAISESLAATTISVDELIYHIMLEVRGMLNQARIFIGEESSIELSHHYGLERFREFGAVIINCINRDYCKKLIIQLPRQKHPYHYHQKKEETFQLLYGDLEVEKNGRKLSLHPGDTVLVEPEEWHKFHTLHGAIFEEMSTTHYNNDSYYEDEHIARLPRDMRKTYLENWNAIIRRAEIVD
ncbi:sialic acid synthase [Candidatus Moduliflexus flocculans]|uniref:Sialic acid synthase n=1 Tax=Candidatus Moduliflexus flocculans TaxID=1499966 RepID=A0A0S6VQL0_9BACT|nr:sialic acid synthase [Candidatus Moduliflexus flocculans]